VCGDVLILNATIMKPDTQLAKTAISSLALCIVAVTLFLAADGPIRLGLLIYPEQMIALVLGCSIGIAFLARSASGRERTFLPWYDFVFAVAGVAIGVHLAVRFPVLSQHFYDHPREILIDGIVLVPLTIEALRRTAGWALVAVVIVFITYALGANLVPGTLQGRGTNFLDLLRFLAIDSTAIFGTPLIIVVTVVLIYILFGNLLSVTGASGWFTDLAVALVGRSRGGSAKIAVVASAFFGSISGSAVANVASTGVITIPMMKKAGFEPRLAGAFEAVASTGGQIMPPVMGAAAFLMAEFLQVPYATVVIAALVPALLYFFAVLIQADLEAGRRKIPPVPEDLIQPVGRVFKDGWYFPLPYIVLVGALFALNMSPAQAALWSALCIVALNLLFGYRGKRIGVRDVWQAIVNTGEGAVEIVVIAAMAGIVIGILENSGLSFGLTFLLVEFGRNSSLLLLVLTAVICIILGMGMPTTGIYLLVATLAAPPLVKLGIDPMAAHLFILYFGLMSMISPPVAIAAFTAASIANTGAMATAVTSMRLGWPAFIIPFLLIYNPGLLLADTWQGDCVAVASAALGVWLASAAIVGFLKTSLSAAGRIGIGLMGFILLLPSPVMESGIYLKLAAVVIALAFTAWSFWGQPAKRLVPEGSRPD
jgi:TRAP transporter 4TM/12TM fusion protein